MFSCFFVLLTNAEFCDNVTVSHDVAFLNISQKVSSVTDHFEQAASRMMILLVNFQMLGELVDPVSQNSDLNLRRTCVAFVSRILLNDLILLFFCHFHFPPSIIIYAVDPCGRPRNSLKGQPPAAQKEVA